MNEPGHNSKSRNTRRYARYPLDVRISASVFRAGDVVCLWGRSTELGLDGIGATLTGELDNGEVVSMEFPLPLCPFPLKLRAIVRYRDGLRYGFEFLTVSAEQRQSLKRVCEMLAASGVTGASLR
ncbi:MAG TPA: PilZ domain-containing protein [Terriglobales bacterium]|nr:PilZ domain-containing protein [Terriglobales bacterium]